MAQLRFPLFLAALLPLLISLASCSLSGEGGGTEAEGLTGTMVNPEGKPVQGALVKVFPVAKATAHSDTSVESPSKASDSTRTNKDGYFAFNKLAEGRYNVEGLSSSENSLLGIFLSDVDESTNLGTTVLMPAGSIRVQVFLDGGPLEGAQCYVPGSSFLSVSDDQGVCRISGIPSGIYLVRLRYPGLITEAIEGVSVEIGMEADVDTVELVNDPTLPPPTPREILAVFDSTLGVVRISWSPVSVVDIAGYVVFRRDAASFTPERLFPQIVRDTFYVDTLSSAAGDSANFLYQVKAQDRNANLSLVYSLASFVAAQFPAIPEQPSPMDGSVGQTSDLILSWKGLGGRFLDSDAYTVYLDTISPPVAKVAENLTDPIHPRNGLLPGRKYFWRVAARLSSREFSGPVWSFSTASSPGD